MGDCNRWLLPSWFATGRLISAIRRKLATKKKTISLQELSRHLRDQKIVKYQKTKLAELLRVYNLGMQYPRLLKITRGFIAASLRMNLTLMEAICSENPEFWASKF